MLDYYRDLLYDEIRINEFKKAIATLVKNKTVAEIGFGLGTYSLFATMSGAKSVYAIEKADVYTIGKEIARRNNLDSKIIFFHDNSMNVELPEKVDFIIMEDYTPMFAYQGLFETITDARNRLLKPGGKFIPYKFHLKFALVEYQEFFNFLQPSNWKDDIVFGINWDYATELLFNQAHHATRPGISLLSEEILLTTIDLTTCNDFTFHFSDIVKIHKPGTIQGIIGWWDCWFTPTQFFSNSPDAPANTWGQMFFPIRYPVTVKAGDNLTVEFNSYRSGITDDINYQWSLKCDQSEQEYNSFIAKIGSRDYLDKLNPDNPVGIDKDGEIARFIFNCIDNKKTYNAIAGELAAAFPNQFKNHEQALFRIFNVLSSHI